MRLFVNFGAVLIFIIAVIAIVCVYSYFNNSIEEGSDTPEKSRRKKVPFSRNKKTDQDTVFVFDQMPVIWYHIPGQEWQNKKMQKSVVTIGRDENCDIVIDHPTVSRKQAEVRMKVHKFYSTKNGSRYYVLKNCALENPVQYCPKNGGEDDIIDIVRTMKIKEKESVFFMGQVEVMFVLPNRKRVKSSSGPAYKEFEKKEEKIASKEKKKEEEKKEEEKKKSGGVKRSDPRSQVRF